MIDCYEQQPNLHFSLHKSLKLSSTSMHKDGQNHTILPLPIMYFTLFIVAFSDAYIQLRKKNLYSQQPMWCVFLTRRWITCLSLLQTEMSKWLSSLFLLGISIINFRFSEKKTPFNPVIAQGLVSILCLHFNKILYYHWCRHLTLIAGN